MSDDGADNTRTRPSFVFVIIRLTGITFAVASLLNLARNGFGIQYKEWFSQYLQSYDLLIVWISNNVVLPSIQYISDPSNLRFLTDFFSAKLFYDTIFGLVISVVGSWVYDKIRGR